MITKHMKTAVVTELAMETPCLPPEDRTRLYTMLTDTFAVEMRDALPDGWKLRVLLRDGSPDADTPDADSPVGGAAENWGAIAAKMDEMAYTVSVSLPIHEILVEGGSLPAIREGLRYLLGRLGTAVGPCGGRIPFTVSSFAYAKNYRENQIDNARILPVIHSDRNVALLSAGAGADGITTPDFLSDMVMAEVHLDTAAHDGSFATAAALVDFYATTGVNALWLCPIYNRDKVGNGYGNRGLHTIDSAYTGCADPSDGWSVVRKFVDYAHGRQVRIFLDVISWGVMKGSPLCAGHPDWFEGEAWGGRAFNWKNEEFRTWFIDKAVENLIYTHADGYRCDCEPNYGGYDVWGEVRRRMYAAGRKIAIIAEDNCDRGGVFDLEQDGVLDYTARDRGTQYREPIAPYLSGIDIVDSVKTGYAIGSAPAQTDPATRGTARYYTHTVTNHDYQSRLVRGNRLVIGYQAILAPFIPVWFCGDEFGMDETGGVIYFSKIRWELLDRAENRIFYEDVKQMLRLRRMFPDIFAYFPENHRDANIERIPVTKDSVPQLTGYARRGDGRAVLVIPAMEDGVYTAQIPRLFTGQITVTDLTTNQVLYDGDAASFSQLRIPLAKERMGIYFMEENPL